MTSKIFSMSLRSWLVGSLVLLVFAGPLALGLAGFGIVQPLMVFDGTYQTFGMLDRLVHFDLPGIRHVPYLGVLLCYALAPFYIVLGHSIYAAYAAAQVLVMLSWLACLWAMIWAIGRPSREARYLACLLFVLYFALYLALRLVPNIPLNASLIKVIYEPAASLIYAREAVSVFLALAIVRIPSPRSRRRAMAVGAGILLFWSPSSGLATLLVASAIQLCGEWIDSPNWRVGVARGLGNLGLTVLAGFGAAFILSGGHPVVLFSRVFLDAAGNQFWFFLPFNDHTRLLNARDLIQMFAPKLHIGALMIAVTAPTIYCWWRAVPFSRRADTIALICASQLLSATFSQAGGHFMGYYLLPYICTASIPIAIWVLDRAKALPWPGVSRRQSALLCGIGLILATVVAIRVQASAAYAQVRQEVATSVWLPEAGMAYPGIASGEVAYLRHIRADMDRRHVPASQRLISSYHAWPSVLLAADPHPRFNSIIHLMSAADRAEFSADFARNRPEMAATLDVSSTSKVEPWNTRSSWPFYRELLANYQPAARGTQFVYWTRRPQSAKIPNPRAPACQIAQMAANRVALTFDGPLPDLGGQPGILDVELSYDGNPGRPGLNGDLGRGYVRVSDRASGLMIVLNQLALAGHDANDALDARPGLLYGLPGGRQTIGIPVEHDPRHTSTLVLEMLGGSRASMAVSGCRVLALMPDPYVTPDAWRAVSPSADLVF